MRILRNGFVITSIALASACGAQQTELQPATAHGHTPAGLVAVTDVERDIRLTAEADGWRGWDPIQAEVTPLRVHLRNGSETPIVVRYDAFQVLGAERTYAVIPPVEMDQDVDAFVAAGDPIADPAWRGADYAVAPYFARLYPGTRVYQGYGFNGGYYASHAGIWTDVELPTAEMMEQVLPEGVIAPGGEVSGVLFFEHVPADAEGLRLVAALRSAETDEVVARHEIPLAIEVE